MNKSTPLDENKIIEALAVSHDIVIPLGNGVLLLWSSSALEEEAWSVHFPGKHKPGLGCTSATAQILIAAANGPTTSVEYSPAQYTQDEVSQS